MKQRYLLSYAWYSAALLIPITTLANSAKDISSQDKARVEAT